MNRDVDNGSSQARQMYVHTTKSGDGEINNFLQANKGAIFFSNPVNLLPQLWPDKSAGFRLGKKPV